MVRHPLSTTALPAQPKPQTRDGPTFRLALGLHQIEVPKRPEMCRLGNS